VRFRVLPNALFESGKALPHPKTRRTAPFQAPPQTSSLASIPRSGFLLTVYCSRTGQSPPVCSAMAEKVPSTVCPALEIEDRYIDARARGPVEK